jgi:hypothetical protein
MSTNEPARLTRICPADGSVMVVQSLSEDCHCCAGCKELRRIVAEREARRAKALRLGSADQKKRNR